MATHEGWSNYPTWCVNLWIGNDEGLYNEFRTLIRRCDRRGDTEHGVADAIKTRFESLMPDGIVGGTVWADLINSALAEVNWRELAAEWAAEWLAAEGSE